MTVPNGWRLRLFGDFLTESRIQGHTGDRAKKLTLRLYGKGLVPKDDRLPGSRNTRYYIRTAGQFVYSKLDFLNGAFAIVPEELAGRETTLDLPAFDVAKDVSPEWLLAYVTRPSFYEAHRGRAKGGRKARRVPPDDFLTIDALTPPISEQKKIAEILGSVDEAIQATQAVIDQTRKVKQGLLQQLLTRGIGHTRFKKTEIGEIPESWTVVSLDDLGTGDEPAVRTGPFGSSMKTSDFRNEGIPVLTIQSLGEGHVVSDGLFFVDDQKATELDHYKVRLQDLVFSRVADIGRSIVIGAEQEGWLISSNLMRLRLDKDRAVADFIMYSIVGGGPLTRQIEMLTGDIGRPVVSSGMMKRLLFVVPPLDEQEAIAQHLRQVDAVVDQNQEVLSGLAELKRGLMQDLLTGRVRVAA